MSFQTDESTMDSHGFPRCRFSQPLSFLISGAVSLSGPLDDSYLSIKPPWRLASLSQVFGEGSKERFYETEALVDFVPERAHSGKRQRGKSAK